MYYAKIKIMFELKIFFIRLSNSLIYYLYILFEYTNKYNKIKMFFPLFKVFPIFAKSMPG